MDFLWKISFWLLTSQMAVTLLIAPKETFAGHHSEQAEAEPDRGAAEAERARREAKSQEEADIQEEINLLQTNPVAARAVKRAVRDNEKYRERVKEETRQIILGAITATGASSLAINSENPGMIIMWAAMAIFGGMNAFDGCQKIWQRKKE